MSFRSVLAALLLSAAFAPAARGGGADQAMDLILSRTKIRKGLCLDVGGGDESLAHLLAAKTKLRIELIEFDKAEVHKKRARIFATGLYGDLETLGTGLSRLEQVAVQGLGVVVYGIWAFGLAFVVFYAGNAVVRFRVSEKAEIAGLNISELGLQHESELQPSVSLSMETSG